MCTAAAAYKTTEGRTIEQARSLMLARKLADADADTTLARSLECTVDTAAAAAMTGQAEVSGGEVTPPCQSA